MSAIITVENISKRYIIRRQTQERYVALRDILANKARQAFKMLRHPLGGFDRCDPGREEFWALKDINFEVMQGDRLGIIGHNGAGKSTILKILSRITEPTTGRIRIKGRVASLLEVGTGFHPELTGRENIFLNGAILGMTGKEIKKKFDEIVDFAEVEKFLDTPVKRYSSGMYVRLAFSVAAHLEPEILLVDEVLAVGDAAFQKKCLGKMGDVSKQGRTVLFVSHNMAAIQHLCNSAALFETGRIKYTGPTSETVELYERDVLSSGGNGEYPPHVIFEFNAENNQHQSDFKIVRIETVDSDGRPKARVSTWDTVKFRITCWARRRVEAGSIALRVSTLYGMPLLLCSTQPGSAVQMTIKEGYTIVECEFASFPLSAGEYMIGAGLAIPNKEWLCRKDQLGLLTVHPKDVYQSGLAPTCSRSILATPHVWNVK